MPWKPLALMLLCFAGPLLLLDSSNSVPDVVQVDPSPIQLASRPAPGEPTSSLMDAGAPKYDTATMTEITIDELVVEPSTSLVTWSLQNIRSTLDRCPSEGSPISGFVGPDRLEMQQGNLVPDLPAGRTDVNSSTSGFSQHVSIQLPRGCQAVIGGDDAVLNQLQNAVLTGKILEELILE